MSTIIQRDTLVTNPETSTVPPNVQQETDAHGKTTEEEQKVEQSSDKQGMT